MPSKPNAKPQRDLISRGQQGTNPLGTSLFVTLRLLDGFAIQPLLLTSSIIPRLCTTWGLPSPPARPTNPPFFRNVVEFLSGVLGAVLPAALGLELGADVDGKVEIDLFGVVVGAMAAGSAVRQSFWLLSTANEPLSPRSAITLGVFNSLINTLNTLFYLNASTNPTWSPYLVPPAMLIYLTGIHIETASESQRKRFKANPQNKGKVFSDGLWMYARHINYFGYVLWRGGFALAAGGAVWGAASAAFFLWDFAKRGVPVLDRYCVKKYGAQWEKVKRDVPWKMVPDVY